MYSDKEIGHLIKTSNILREPLLHSIIDSLILPPGSHGLDAGCGIGLPAMLLAEAAGHTGHITGIDNSAGLIDVALEISRENGFSERITFRQGDIHHLPFDDNHFDWAWSADCVGYAPLDTPALVSELVRVIRPGGMLYILAWSSETLLPGLPLLEAHLKATRQGLAPFTVGRQPGLHFLRSLGCLKAAGLVECMAQPFVHGICAPLSDDVLAALKDLFMMRWEGVEKELNDQAREEYRRFCLPESEDFILHHPDYYAFYTYSLFQGKVPGCS